MVCKALAITAATGLTAAFMCACGSKGTRPTTPARLQQAQTTHEYPAPKPAPAPRSVSGGAASPEGAVRHFARTYINWSAHTVAGQMRALAAESVGQAHSAMQLAATQTAHDYELQQGGISNSGTVEAIAPLARGRNRFAVVTREATAATNTTAYQGLRPAWHVALATVVQLSDGRWVVSGWQPEN